MAFVGSINQDVRAWLSELAPRWRDRAVYVGCSGNYSVERILHQAGVRAIHGNDVSLYSCAIGAYLTGRDLRVTLQPEAAEAFGWLAEYLEPGPATIATLMLSTEFLKAATGRSRFAQRLADAYRAQWPALHGGTVEKLQRQLEGVHLASFTAGDVVDYVAAAPEDAVVISFPPTYEAGYSRLYKAIDATFAWAAPTFTEFNDERFEQFTNLLRARPAWVTLRDADVEALRPWCVGRVQTGARMKPVYLYAADGPVRVTDVHQTTEPVPVRRCSGAVTGPLTLVRLTAGQLNTLRAEYLATNIIPSGAQVNLGLLSGGELVGAMAFSKADMLGGFCDVYMMSDFCVRPSVHVRLAKLVLACTQTTEVKAVLEQQLGQRLKVLGTTAFTHKPVSMKYRGLMELYSRKPGALNYVAPMGKWPLAEALAWWQQTHGGVRQEIRA